MTSRTASSLHSGKRDVWQPQAAYGTAIPCARRCSTPLAHRVVDEWFIACSEVREPMRRAAAAVSWHPSHYAKRMDDWLSNMGDLPKSLLGWWYEACGDDSGSPKHPRKMSATPASWKETGHTTHKIGGGPRSSNDLARHRCSIRRCFDRPEHHDNKTC